MRSKLIDLSIADFFQKMADQPPPGGGSAAALNGLTGVSLLAMAAGIMEENQSSSDDACWTGVREELLQLHKRLGSQIDRDAQVLSEILPIFSQNDQLDGQQQEDKKAVAACRAIAVPLETAALCLGGMELAKQLLAGAEGYITGDLLFGALCCHTGLDGALLMSAINLPMIACEHQRKQYVKKIRQYNHTAQILATNLKAAVYSGDMYRCME